MFAGALWVHGEWTRGDLASRPGSALGFPGGSVVISLTMQETEVRSLGWGDPLEKKMATYCSIVAYDRENTAPSPPTDREAWEATIHEVTKESDRT